MPSITTPTPTPTPSPQRRGLPATRVRRVLVAALAVVAVALPGAVAQPASAAALPRVTGRVVDEAGHPRAGIRVGDYFDYAHAVTTAADGTFSFQMNPSDRAMLAFQEAQRVSPGEGYAQVELNTAMFDLSSDLATGDVVLPAMTPETVVMVDKDGDPVSDVSGNAECTQAGTYTPCHDSWNGPTATIDPPLTADWYGYNVLVRPTGIDGATHLYVPAISDGVLPRGVLLNFTDETGTRYAYDLSAAVPDGAGRWVLHMDDLDVPPVTRPASPTHVRATGGARTADVRWDVPAANGAPITKYTVTASPGGRVLNVPASASPVAHVEGLTNGQSYSFTVTATNQVGTSDPSAPSDPVLIAGPPDPVATLTATGLDASAEVSWAPPASDGGSPVTGYFLTSSATDVAVNVPATQTSYTWTGLTNGQSYRFSVQAVTQVGAGPISWTRMVVAAGVPARPAAPTAIVHATWAGVSWRAPAGNGAPVAGYRVTLILPSGKSRVDTSSLPRTTLWHLKAGVYRVSVEARNMRGWSLASPALKFRIRGPAATASARR